MNIIVSRNLGVNNNFICVVLFELDVLNNLRLGSPVIIVKGRIGNGQTVCRHFISCTSPLITKPIWSIPVFKRNLAFGYIEFFPIVSSLVGGYTILGDKECSIGAVAESVAAIECEGHRILNCHLNQILAIFEGICTDGLQRCGQRDTIQP